jgi:hypothetical protein
LVNITNKISLVKKPIVFLFPLSFIKGSYEAISSESGYLGIKEYLEVGNKKAPTFRDAREHIYTIFMEYERLKKRKQKHNWFFDQTDYVFRGY